jgi:hypothetical protein
MNLWDVCPDAPVSRSHVHVPSMSGHDADRMVSTFRFDEHLDRTSMCHDSVTRESGCAFHLGVSGRLTNLLVQAWAENG